ncbi:uncharacterized protein [Palaemon carinicauda]|uniref:uncharacterized protein isoform X1 n=1 Tax=Palaemon carinicauda TaxID=392227 RepID=UPI0035B5DEC4
MICAMFGCYNHDRHRQEKGISFYRFPRDPSLSKIWVSLCRRKDDFNVKNARVCSVHFAPSDFGESLRHRLLDYHPINARKLKDTAVPTQHVYTKDITPDMDSSPVKEEVTEPSIVTVYINEDDSGLDELESTEMKDEPIEPEESDYLEEDPFEPREDSLCLEGTEKQDDFRSNFSSAEVVVKAKDMQYWAALRKDVDLKADRSKVQEEASTHSASRAAYMREYRAKQTYDRSAQRRAQNALSMRIRRAQETLEERLKRKQRDRERYARLKDCSSESEESKAHRREQARLRARIKLQNETEEEREDRKEKAKLRARIKLQNETEEEREVRKEQARLRARIRWQNEKKKKKKKQGNRK